MFINDFRRVPGKGCITTTMASLIQRTIGLALTEELVFLAAGGIVIGIHRFPLENSYEYHVRSHSFNLDVLSESFGIALERTTAQNPEAAWTETARVLETGRPQAVWIDIYHMPYSKNYRTNHARHVVVVTGLDAAAGQVSISDFEFEGSVPLAVMSAARCKLDLAYDGFALAHTHQGPQDVTAPMLLTWLDRNLATYTGRLKETKDDIWIGPVGLELLKRDLLGPVAEAGVMGRYTYDTLFGAVSAPGGMIHARQCMSEVLKHLAERVTVNPAVWFRAADVYASLTRKWRMFAAMLLKATMEGPQSVRTRLGDCLDQLQEQEQFGLDVLQQGLMEVGMGQWTSQPNTR